MTFPISIDRPILYEFIVSPFPTITGRSVVHISNSNSNAGVLNYYLESFSFNNDVFDPVQTGVLKVIQTQYDNIDFMKHVLEGDLIYLKENGTNIFSGYIETISFTISAQGTTISVKFGNLLKQLSKSKVFGNILNSLMVVNKINFGQFLSLIVKNSLVQASAYISGTPNFTFLKGNNESASTVLNGSNVVYVTVTNYMNILQAINKILYPYQRYIYQDASGAIVIAPLTLFNDSTWNFTQHQNNIFSSRIFPYISITGNKRAGETFNQVYGILMNVPIAVSKEDAPKLNGFCSYFSAPPQYFTRLNDLYSSGQFVLTDITNEDVISDPARLDQVLSSISTLVQGQSLGSGVATTIAATNQNAKYVPSQTAIKSSTGGPDTSCLIFNHVARTMAEHLISETEITVTAPRSSQTDANFRLLPLPINKMVNLFLDPGIIETSALFCRGYTLSYSDKGTIVSLSLCKPLTGGAFWVNEELVSG